VIEKDVTRANNAGIVRVPTNQQLWKKWTKCL